MARRPRTARPVPHPQASQITISSPADFWRWFRGFAGRLPADDPPEQMMDELLDCLQRVDRRVFFELALDASARELILTAGGDAAVFGAVDALIQSAPDMPGWTFTALKPALGFDFTHENNGIEIDASKLWFLPLKSAAGPQAIGICLGLPNVDFILEHETVDTAYTILETGIGERSCALDVSHVEVDELPQDPAAAGYLPVSRLREYIGWYKRKTGR